MGMIHLEEITNKNIWKVCTLEVMEGQKNFVADNIQSLAEAFATRNEGNHALPLAVYNDADLIGFVMIGKGTVGNENESELIRNNYSLWRLMIDQKYQGKGLGKIIMKAQYNSNPDAVKFPGGFTRAGKKAFTSAMKDIQAGKF